jgi:hypothetical protein
MKILFKIILCIYGDFINENTNDRKKNKLTKEVQLL